MGVFSKKDKIALDQQAISTLISEGSTITGNLNAPAVARIDGHVNGDVQVDEGLILGEKGLITGNITTKEMTIYGTVNGNIAVQSLEIKGTGKVTGDIETVTLLVEAGGVYNGHLAMSVTDTKQIKQIA
ncbi:polymer-forming cytoskeletal protein [Mucilaginibacter sp. UR6-11]|uniref:bactofilin family protein n=1 Tax=Mucilaginibacter sp. UR6-11 TaxID=1435644 RepID=UPI001E38201B|nr:polymer-forming cytoskeletal protein [Mucilaginibacter sp. UR6-11]MCC8424943.1 polymer-forming cytoskeletal protein [Mucilaginibacter sp. UR6-11]